MDLLEIWRIVQVVLGIGLIIFVHEAGHFLAARGCGVRVHVFSLGFGPTLLAWKRGHTTYKVCCVPLGGYVRMAGDETMGKAEEAKPWELGAKSVGQRFFIFSGGVLANVAFGLVVFPILFIAGIPSFEPLVGDVERGSPAWVAELEPGTRVLSVNGVEIYDANQIPAEVVYNGRAPDVLVVQPPGEEVPRKVELQPVFDRRGGFYTIGNLGLPMARDRTIVVSPDGPAKAAGLSREDRFLRIEGEPPGLAPSLQLWRAQERGGPIRVVVEREGEEVSIDLEPKVLPEEGGVRMGVAPLQNRVGALRADPGLDATALRVGDELVLVGGRPVFSQDQLLEALLAADDPIEWLVRRDGADVRLASPPLTPKQRVALWNDVSLHLDEEHTGIVVLPDTAAAAAGLRDGDVIASIDGAEVSDFGEIREAAREAGKEERAMRLGVRRAAETGPGSVFTVEVRPRAIPLHDYGFSLDVARYTFRVGGFWQAVGHGGRGCWNMLRDVGRTLRGVLRRDVSEKSVGGIISIGVFAHRNAESGWVRFFWFLCLLSMNLAFLNVLPIPLLDGGHLFFLLIEGIKGSPVSERILGYSQLVGLVLIVSLFVFVIYNDVTIHFFGD